jgi:uncharacterized protein YjdB
LAVTRMLSKEPTERWPSLRDAVRLLGHGLPSDVDSGRPALAQLVRVSPAERPEYAVTPRSPIPHPMPPAATAVVGPRAPIPEVEIASLDIVARQHALEVGATECIRCRALDAQGNEVSGIPEWSSSNPAIASVDGAGVVTAHESGTVTIAAMMDTLAAMVTLDVVPSVARVAPEPTIALPAPLAEPRYGTLGIVPGDPAAVVGEDLLLGAKVTDANGRVVEASTVTWRSLTPAIATVDSKGFVRARRAGTAIIVAASNGLETRVEIPVTESASRRLAVRVAVGAGIAIAAMLAIWALSRKPDGRLPAASATAAGTVAMVPAAAQPVAPSVAPTVRTPVSVPTDSTIASLVLTDASPITIEVGEVRPSIVQALNKGGELVPASRIGWELSNPAVASVDADGGVTALAVGRTLITARAGQLTRVVAVDVREASVMRMRLTVARDSLQVGDSTTASVQALDTRDTALERKITWRSSNPTVATVDGRGVVRAESVGQATIMASAGALGDSVAIVVSSATAAAGDSTVDTVRVAPSSTRQIAPPTRGPLGTVTPREVSALPAGARVPSEAESQTVVDSVVGMIGRRVVRVAQLTRGAGEPGVQFQQFLEQNTPSASLAGAPIVHDVRATSARISFGVVLEWEAPTKRERTVNLECVLDAVRGGWAIREIRFPTGFTP